MRSSAKAWSAAGKCEARMNALVLSGGGAKGAYEAGLVSTLVQEFHEDFDIVCGTSIGAINAAMIAQGQVEELAALWRSIGPREIITPYPRVQALRETYAAFVRAHDRGVMFRPFALATALLKLLRSLPALNPLKTLAKLTGAIDPGPTQQLLREALRYERVERVLIVTATDLISQTEEVFYRFPGAYSTYQDHFVKENPFSEQFNEADFYEAIRASGAIPGAFSPVSLASAAERASYVDGGIVNNTPIGLAIDAGATDITVIYLDPMPSKEPILPAVMTIPEILFNCFSVMQQRLLALDHRLALMMNDAVENKTPVGSSKRMVRMRTFRPLLPLAVGVIDFDKQDLVDKAFFAGQLDARDAAQRTAFIT
jgi:predicted acylesterase/phospholipase RssA